MKNWICLTMTVTALALGVTVAQAETGTPSSPELMGIEKVYDIIGNVSLAQSDQKTKQSVLDMLELKDQLDVLDMRATEAPAQLSAHARHVPPSRRAKTF